MNRTCLVFLLAFGFVVLSWPRPTARADMPAVQWGDPRFGVFLAGDPQQLATLGTRWFLGPSEGSAPPSLPAGSVWVLHLPVHGDDPVPSDIASRVARHPGSYWQIGSEPNVRKGPGEQTAEQYSHFLHDAATSIKAADPTARIVGPNIINFDFTCIDCPGYTSGHDWLNQFLAVYAGAYGVLPSIDVWSIHSYPLDFGSFPQVNAGIAEDQISEFRSYLDGSPGLAGAPIWLTEFGTQWAYDGLEWHDDGSGNVKAYPVGAYRADLSLSYLQSVVGWLMQNGPSLHVDRWFFFSTYQGAPETWESVPAGIDLLDGSGPNAALTPFGQLYRRLAGLSP